MTSTFFRCDINGTHGHTDTRTDPQHKVLENPWFKTNGDKGIWTGLAEYVQKTQPTKEERGGGRREESEF